MVYRASYRGTKEMDWLLGKYVEAMVQSMNEAEIQVMEAFLMRPDPELENWLMGRDTMIDPEFLSLVKAIQVFHKI